MYRDVHSEGSSNHGSSGTLSFILSFINHSILKVVDAVRRLSHPNTQVISYVNVTLRTLQGSAPNWQPLLPGAVAPELPQPTSARAEHPSGGLRKEIHILVDNVVRDLGSVSFYTISY